MNWQQTLEAYERAWAQDDERKIRAWVEECWTANSTYVNPLTDTIRGIDGLTRLILDYPVMFPDAAVRASSAPEVHGDHIRYHWQLSSTARIRTQGRDFGRVMDGVDIIEFDADGKIRTVVSSFEVQPTTRPALRSLAYREAR